MTAPEGWVGARFGVRLSGAVAGSGLVELALRRNPRRAHLLVSTVLGKHIPADPRVVHGAGLRLGSAVRDVLGDADAVVLGFAETATGLGHAVAQALAARYVHSTRRAVEGAAQVAGFEEEHSHATTHRLLPEDPSWLTGGDPLVLVDDELSTGRTALNTIRALHRPRRTRYVVAALVDLRAPHDTAIVDAVAAELGVTIEVVSLAAGGVDWPADFPTRAAELVGAENVAVPAAVAAPGCAQAPVRQLDAVWPVGVRDGGRHGFGPTDVRRAVRAAGDVASALLDGLTGGRVLVLGTEELMYAPVLIALALAETGVEAQVSSTTRSPVHVVDEPDYPIRSAVTYTGGSGQDGGTGPRFAYNVTGFDDIVLVTDEDVPLGLLDGLRVVCRCVHVVSIPSWRPSPPPLTGPGFGSYRPAEVSWLLTDLSETELEAPTEEREEAIQSGGAHYAESLPVEYQPDDAYLALFEQALVDSADRIARAVGVVTELLLAERGTTIALASLARAGTPVGVLIRRWAALTHGLQLPHYAISIVRGRGIDTEALRLLAGRHDPGDIVFVDGWTGKGAIARELAVAIENVNRAWGTGFDASLAVLADPGSCVATFGTRADFLIPSACLNSTVSGLVSRTVLNPMILLPGQFHGAKFYRELAEADVSGRFLDAISDRFSDVAADVQRDLRVQHGADRTPTWAGWAEVEALSQRYGIGDVTLVKPGVGETTRVLLRRVPWAVLIRPDAVADLTHVRLLAQRRGVPVHEVADLAYSCVGLIHPEYTRGATGSDGRTAVSS